MLSHTLQKSKQMCNSIALKFGLLQIHTKANSCTKLDTNLMDVPRVMELFAFKKDQYFVMSTGCTAYGNDLIIVLCIG